MIGSIIIGVAVDDTIHFMHQFESEFTKTSDAQKAIESTLQTTGMALLFTSLVLSGGFLTFAGAYMSNMFYFGVLSAGAIAVAFIANITLSPAIVAVLNRTTR